MEDNTIKLLVEKIKSVGKLHRIILFGSYASGKINSNSDIDLLVVIDSNKMPENFKEKSNNYLKIGRAIREIERKIPIDLLVYTKPEFEIMVSSKSLFINKILNEGKDLL